MKKKILFYGNCQTGVLGEWLHNNYSDKFEVVDCGECGLFGFWSSKNFAIWSLENTPNQKYFYKCVKEKIEECDIFVFTHIEDRAIEELQTKNLCSTVALNKLKICMPNPRFLAYPICKGSLQPFIKYVYQNVSKNEKEIFDYLLNENDPKFQEIVNQQYETCTNDNIIRFENYLSIYRNVINVNDVISNNWKKNLLFGTTAHPIGVYWEHVIEKMVKMLDMPFEIEKTKNVIYPNRDGIHDPRTFSFFNSIFPNILIPSEICNFYKTEIDMVKEISDQLCEKNYKK